MLLANGVIEQIVGEVTLPITLAGITRKVAVGIVPELTDSCALGMDFAKTFGIILDLNVQRPTIIEEPISKNAFDSIGRIDLEECVGHNLVNSKIRIKRGIR